MTPEFNQPTPREKRLLHRIAKRGASSKGQRKIFSVASKRIARAGGNACLIGWARMRTPLITPPKKNRKQRRHYKRGVALIQAWLWDVKVAPNEPTKSIIRRIEERKRSAEHAQSVYPIWET